jgi:hypothetical protein
MKTKTIVILFSLLIISSVALAQTEQTTPTETSTDELTQSQNIPEGCSSEGFTFQNGQLILGLGNGLFNQQVYFVHNNSDYEQLLLSHPTNTAMSA